MKKPIKKRNKKYNSMDKALASARLGLKNLAVFHSKKDCGEKFTCIMVNYKTANQVTVGTSMAFAVGEIKHKWSIHMLAIGIESNGKRRFEVDEVALTEALFQHQLVDYLNEQHKELEAKFKERNKLTNTAWLAVPNGDSIGNDKIDAILTKYVAW